MDYMSISGIAIVLAIFLAAVGVTSIIFRYGKISYVIILLALVCSCVGVICNLIHKEGRVIVMLYKTGDVYHLKCDDNDVLRKIAEVLPEIPEDELVKMDFESLSLQKSVDWKVNALAKGLEKEIGGGAEFRTDIAGFKRMESVSKEEVERVVREYVIKIKK